jgi:hypothetical protein
MAHALTDGEVLEVVARARERRDQSHEAAPIAEC